MNKKIVWILLFEDFEVDGRTQRQVSALKDKYDVTIFSSCSDHERFEYLGAHFVNLKSFYGFFSPVTILIRLLRGRVSPDYILLNNIYTIPALLMLKVLYFKAKFIYDSHELIVPDPVTKKSIASNKSIFLERLGGKLADLVVTTNKQRALLMKDYYRLPKLPTFIENFVESTSAAPNKYLNGTKRPVMFIYQGILKNGRYLHEMIETFSLLSNVQLHIYGFGEAELGLVELANRRGALNKSIFFYGKMSRDNLYIETLKYDVGLVIYDFSNMNNKYCSPNKTSEYILSGLPILTTPQKSLKAIIDNTCVGSYFNYEALESKNYQYLSSQVDDFAKNIREYTCNVEGSRHLFDFKSEAVKLCNAIDSIK